MKMPDGSTESWALLPPGNLPTYRRENWTEQTIQVGYQVTATGNLGRDGTKKLYATCINVGTGPEQGRQLGRCATSGTVTQVTADPERRLHREGQRLRRRHHGLLGQPLSIPSHRRRLPAEADADDGASESDLRGPQVRRRPRAALPAARPAAHLRLAVPDADRRLRARTT